MKSPETLIERIDRPGSVIELGTLANLATFEDIVAYHMWPKMNPFFWEGRPLTKDLIRPPKFNGNINDIQLITMANPEEEIKGKTLAKSKAHIQNITNANTVGFDLIGRASSGASNLGVISTQLFFYIPNITVTRKDGSRMTLDPRVASAKRSEFAIHRSNGNAYGMNLRVIVIKPDFDTVAHTQVEQQIRERAHRIEARNLRTAIKIPMKS